MMMMRDNNESAVTTDSTSTKPIGYAEQKLGNITIIRPIILLLPSTSLMPTPSTKLFK